LKALKYTSPHHPYLHHQRKMKIWCYTYQQHLLWSV
jgi:hypothetical protein